MLGTGSSNAGADSSVSGPPIFKFLKATQIHLSGFFRSTKCLMYYVYILQSEQDASFYIGYTSDIERRLEEHNEGKSRYTSKKTPWQLVYFEKFEEKSDAIKREIFLKRQKSHAFYLRLIADFSKKDIRLVSPLK